MEERAWVLGSTMKEMIAFIKHLLYGMHSPRCLEYGPSFSPHHNPGKQIQLSCFTDKETEAKRNERLNQSWGLISYPTLGYDIREAEKNSWQAVLTWVSCHISLTAPIPTPYQSQFHQG